MVPHRYNFEIIVEAVPYPKASSWDVSNRVQELLHR
jgi:hypothetical protein